MSRTSTLTLVATALALSACSSSHSTAGPAITSPSPAPASRATTAPAPVPTPSESPSPAPIGPAGGPVPSGFTTTGVSFVSATEGFAFGSTETCASKPCTSVLRTRDAGRTWVGISAPRAPVENDTLSTAHLTFADEADGFAWGPGLWATHDGGATWHRVKLTGRVLDLAAGAGRVYAVTTTCSVKTTDCSTPGQLLAGPAADDLGQPVAGVDLYDGQLSSITTHGSAVWITAGRELGNSSSPGLKLFGSTDGTTFDARTTPCKDQKGKISWEAFAVAASGDVNLAATCVSEPGAGMQEKQEWTSADAGRTWTRAGDPPAVSGDLVDGFAATTKGTFLSDRTGLDVTRDGTTWTASFADDAGGAEQVGFVTDDLGFLVDSTAKSRLLVTRDAGMTWTPVAF